MAKCAASKGKEKCGYASIKHSLPSIIEANLWFKCRHRRKTFLRMVHEWLKDSESAGVFWECVDGSPGYMNREFLVVWLAFSAETDS